MNDIEYIENRLQKQQQYHSKKSSEFKRCYITLSVITLSLSAAIPVITYLTDLCPLIVKMLISLLSGGATVITGFLSLTKMQEIYVEYRIISERLKSLEFLYKTKTPPFNKEDAFELLVFECENIISQGTNKWYSVVNKNQEN